MTNEELIKIREDRNQTKAEFAKLIGITPMMQGRYEGGKLVIPESVVEKVKELTNKAAAEEIEVKKTARKGAKKVKEAVETVKEAVEKQAVAEEIEVKKTVRKAAKKVKEAVPKVVVIPNIIIQSPMGGHITAEEIAKKVPEGTADVYVRVDENKLYYVLADGENGDVDIWD